MTKKKIKASPKNKPNYVISITFKDAFHTLRVQTDKPAAFGLKQNAVKTEK